MNLLERAVANLDDGAGEMGVAADREEEVAEHGPDVVRIRERGAELLPGRRTGFGRAREDLHAGVGLRR